MGEQLRTVGALGHQVTVAILLLHVLSMAVRNFHNDLMDSRRRFRLALALLLPTVGLAIAAAETYAMFRPLPGWIGLLHACVPLGLAGMFALWLTSIKPDLMVEAGEAGQRPDALPPAQATALRASSWSTGCLKTQAMAQRVSTVRSIRSTAGPVSCSATGRPRSLLRHGA